MSATPAMTELVLKPGAKADISLFRLFPSAVQAGLEFKSEPGNLRPVLGEWRHNNMEDAQQSGSLYFPNPGAAVKLLLSVGESAENIEFNALPASSRGSGAIERTLIPSQDMGDPHRFPLESSGPALSVPIGTSHLHVTVVEIEPPILDERVTLLVSAPVSLKQVAVGYSAIWWFGFWPVYAVVLAIYGLILLAITKRDFNSTRLELLESPENLPLSD